ncbi:tetratricopeptide repeat (TPR)-like superfamily protein [Actinidia rufa]|uniref:Tetratricopeptide repeat (TPR)-like superfamily protein n=1 Tax=Actinidia rufa TaxID=165716 RepID=A0A7J0F676_9ERIC|nr:tetratricopeptide repeat (TPR)-like superfamily protein [Actinidia rufa]
MYFKCNSSGCAHKAFDDLPIKNTHSWNTIIAAYSQMGRFDIAHKLFDEMPEPNIVSYNSLISGLTRHGFYKESIRVFRGMQKQCNGVFMDEFTVISVVSACACFGALELLRQVHGVAVVIGLKCNVPIYNAMIYAYGKCGDPENSFLIFNQMVERDVVSWTSMVVAYARASRLEDARQVFNQMPTKNTVSWSALIAGFAQNGRSDEALDLFMQMQEESIQSNSFTYVSVLSACADLALVHKGKQLHGHIIRSLVYEGLRMLESMEQNYYVIPRSEHYAILIDLLGRKNILNEAMELIERAPDGFNHVGMLGALLSACRIHGNLDLACRAGAALFKLEPQNAGRHVMLSNIYSAAGKWVEAREARFLMEAKRLTKDTAYSWIEVRNTRHQFIAKDEFHCEMEEIYALLDKLSDHMKDAWYLTNNDKLIFS